MTDKDKVEMLCRVLEEARGLLVETHRALWLLAWDTNKLHDIEFIVKSMDEVKRKLALHCN